MNIYKKLFAKPEKMIIPITQDGFNRLKNQIQFLRAGIGDKLCINIDTFEGGTKEIIFNIKSNTYTPKQAWKIIDEVITQKTKEEL